MEERKKLEAAIQKELKGKDAADDSMAGPAASQAAAAAGSSSGEASAAAADAQEDALDAFMSDVQHQIEEDKVLLPRTQPETECHAMSHGNYGSACYTWQDL